MGDDGVAFGAAISFVEELIKSLRDMGLPYWGFKITIDSIDKIICTLDKSLFKVNKYPIEKLSKVLLKKLQMV